MIRWSVGKGIKNYKRVMGNLMSIYNWSLATKYSNLNASKKFLEDINLLDLQINNSSVFIGLWEDRVKLRLEQLESESVFEIRRG
jgi:hypothetical protein